MNLSDSSTRLSEWWERGGRGKGFANVGSQLILWRLGILDLHWEYMPIGANVNAHRIVKSLGTGKWLYLRSFGIPEIRINGSTCSKKDVFFFC